jgi:hypothetical protein
VRFISISVDPATDTPERLKRGARNFMPVKVGPLSQGKSHRLTSCLRVLGASSARREDHSPTCSSATTRTALDAHLRSGEYQPVSANHQRRMEARATTTAEVSN